MQRIVNQAVVFFFCTTQTKSDTNPLVIFIKINKVLVLFSRMVNLLIAIWAISNPACAALCFWSADRLPAVPECMGVYKAAADKPTGLSNLADLH